jgi:outer membrane protein
MKNLRIYKPYKISAVFRLGFIMAVLSMVIAVPSRGQSILSLDSCRSMAFAYNQDLKVATRGVDAAESSARATRANLYPDIDFRSFYMFSDGVNPEVSPSDLDNIQLYNLGLQISQNIYRGRQVQYSAQIADQEVDKMNALRDLSETELIYYTDQLYWQTVMASEMVDLARDYTSVIEELYEVVKNRTEAEIIGMNDLLLTEVQLNDARLENIKSDNNLKVSTMYLNRLIGLNVNSNTVVASKIIPGVEEPEGPERPDAEQSAMENRPELKAQKAEMDISSTSVDLAKSSYHPALTGSVGGGYGATSISGINDPGLSVTALVSLNLPIYEFGQRKHEVAYSRINFEMSELEYQKLEDIISLEVNSAVYNIEQSRQKVELTYNSLLKARENLGLLTNQYREGLASVIEVINAQIFWQKAYLSNIQARYKYMLDITDYNKAIGLLRG